MALGLSMLTIVMLDDIGFDLATGGVTKDDIRDKVAWTADLLRLSEHLGRRPEGSGLP